MRDMNGVEERQPSIARLVVLLLFVTACGCLLILYGTRKGIGLSSDSVYYLAGANSIAGGEGYSARVAFYSAEENRTQITISPPLYSFLISMCGSNVYKGARVLSVVLFGMTLFLSGWICYRLTRSEFGAVLAAVVILFSFPLLYVHFNVWSEHPFIVFSLATILLLIYYMQTDKTIFLIFAALAAAGAFLCRYAGVYLFPIGLLATIFKKRSRHSILFIAISVILPCAWMLRNNLVHGHVLHFSFGFHLLNFGRLEPGITDIGQWFGRRTLTAGLIVLLVAVLSGSSILIRRLSPALKLFAIAALFYPFFVATALSIYDGSAPIDHRILAPWFPLLTILVICAIPWSRIRQPWSAFGLILIAFLLQPHAVASLDYAYRSYATDQGYAAKKWVRSLTLSELRKLPAETLIYTNHEAPVMYWTKHPVRVLPYTWNLKEGGRNLRFDAELNDAVLKVRQTGGLIAFVDDTSYTKVVESALLKHPTIQLWKKLPDGRIYTVDHALRTSMK